MQQLDQLTLGSKQQPLQSTMITGSKNSTNLKKGSNMPATSISKKQTNPKKGENVGLLGNSNRLLAQLGMPSVNSMVKAEEDGET